MWNTTGRGLEYRYNFTDPDVTSVTVAFRKSRGSTVLSSDNVKLYELKVVNTRQGGAAECTQCMVGGNEAGYVSSPCTFV